jgi:hypothetical protein
MGGGRCNLQGVQSLWVQSAAELTYGIPAPSCFKDPPSESSGETRTSLIAFIAIPSSAVLNSTDLPSVPSYLIDMVCPLTSCPITIFS